MTQVRQRSHRSIRTPSGIRRWLAVAAVAISLIVPAVAVGESPQLPRGIMGPTNQDPATGTGLAERTRTELAMRVEAASGGEAATAAEGFSWGDAGIAAGAVVGLVALAGAVYAVRRRAHAAPRPAV